MRSWFKNTLQNYHCSLSPNTYSPPYSLPFIPYLPHCKSGHWVLLPLHFYTRVAPVTLPWHTTQSATELFHIIWITAYWLSPPENFYWSVNYRVIWQQCLLTPWGFFWGWCGFGIGFLFSFCFFFKFVSSLFLNIWLWLVHQGRDPKHC